MTHSVEFVQAIRLSRVGSSLFPLVISGLLLPAATWAQVTYTGTAANQNFGSQALGSTSTAKTLSFSISAGTTVGSIGVVTQGAPNLDFTEATGSACVAQDYASAATCKVNVAFTPKFAGLRMGAVVFFSEAKNTGSILGSVMTYGTGTGAQIGFGPGTATAIAPTVNGETLSGPWGVAVDGAGDVYIGDSYNSRVVKVPADGGASIAITPTVNGTLMSNPYGVAVDGAGDLFITDPNFGRVLEVPVGGGAAIGIYPVVDGRGLTYSYGLAVDGAGDLFIDDCNNARVVEVPAGGGAPIALTPVANGEGLSITVGVAVDATGDVFIGDYGNNRVVEVPAGGGAATVVDTTVNGIGLLYPAAMATDGAGDLFIADAGNNRVVEVPAQGGEPIEIAPTVNGLAINYPQGVTLTGAGDLLIVDLGNNRVVTLQRSQPPALSFAGTPVGSISSDSPQTVQVESIGNEALVLTAVTYPADFPEAGGDADACTGSTSLSAGKVCDLLIEFAPERAGPLSENLTLTDNALNVANATQSISLSGTGGPPIATLSAKSISFPNVGSGGSSASQSVTLTNTGALPLSITSISVTGANASSFVFANSCRSILAGGANCTIHGHFTPATPGPLTAAITISDNATGSPQSIALSGTGLTPGKASLSASSLSFGTVRVGSGSASKSVTLTNTGGTRLPISSIAVTGADASSFVFGNNCGLNLAAGASCSIHGHFTPTTTGALNATVTITDNAVGSSQSITQSIALTGTGQ